MGYLSFLKIGPALLRFPGRKDLRNWLTAYGYWNQGGRENVEGATLRECLGLILRNPGRGAESPATLSGRLGAPEASSGDAGAWILPPRDRSARRSGHLREAYLDWFEASDYRSQRTPLPLQFCFTANTSSPSSHTSRTSCARWRSLG